MSESRKNFEEWIKAERPMLFLEYVTGINYPGYADPATENLWQAWQASRQALLKLESWKIEGAKAANDDKF